MISNEQLERFKNLDLQTLESIPDEKLRLQALQLKRKQGGFTLLELLVVVAILAVMGGLAIGAYGDKTTQAARGGGTNTIAAVSSMVMAYQATAKVLPDNLDTLVCGDATATDYTAATTSDYGGSSDLPGVGGGMGAKLNGKVSRVVVPDASASALYNAGITKLRYAASTSCDTDAATGGAALTGAADTDTGAGLATASAFTYPAGSLAEADIPLRGFDFPIESGKNRGRGYVKQLDISGALTGNDVVLQIWNPGKSGGVNNVKVGAAATDALAVLGLGNNAGLVTDTSGNRVAASAPFYGDLAKDKYGRYLALVKIGTNVTVDADGNATGFAALSATGKASFITVVDPKGDFLDEEYAEATGQKS